jgi:hypothetical protein
MGKGRSAVVLKRAEDGIGVDLVAGASEEATAVIAAQIVAMRGNCASRDVGARCAGFQDGIPDLAGPSCRDAALRLTSCRSFIRDDNSTPNATAIELTVLLLMVLFVT